MEIEDRKRVCVYAGIGVLIAVLIIAGISLSGVQPPSEIKAGTLIILITDSPVNLKNPNVTVDTLYIQDERGNWVELQLLDEAPVCFDLLALRNVSETLSITQIPAGNYTMLKMHVLTANATFVERAVVNLRVPSGEVKVLLEPHLEMKSASSITITIDLEPEWSKIVISHTLNLKPVLKAIVG